MLSEFPILQKLNSYSGGHLYKVLNQSSKCLGYFETFKGHIHYLLSFNDFRTSNRPRTAERLSPEILSKSVIYAV
jgi:hypothetical protein